MVPSRGLTLLRLCFVTFLWRGLPSEGRLQSIVAVETISKGKNCRISLIKMEPGKELILKSSPTWFANRCILKIVLHIWFLLLLPVLTHGKSSFFLESKGLGWFPQIPCREQKVVDGLAVIYNTVGLCFRNGKTFAPGETSLQSQASRCKLDQYTGEVGQLRADLNFIFLSESKVITDPSTTKFRREQCN